MASPTPTPSRNPPCVLLRTRGTSIITPSGKPIILKGCGIGGFLNMENFITGYSGHEHEHRHQLTTVLGPALADFYFSTLIKSFFSSSDAQFIASLGLNCVRIPFNYRHFIDPLNPAVLKPEGFELLDHVVEVCGQHNLYVILDLHAAPGGQNQDWHSDSGISRALFWEFRSHQDLAIRLWESLARRYVGNPVVAGYNPLNEPADPSPQAAGLVSFYSRAEKAIRAVDKDHILFLDGNTYAMDFSAFPAAPFENTVYSIHDYSLYGFPIAGREQYAGSAEQKAKLLSQFRRKAAYMKDKGVPVWNGEFGPVYADAGAEGAEAINEKRYAMLAEQLRIYREEGGGVGWSIWLYKDIGHQGMVHASASSPYLSLVRPFLEKKKALGLDFWGAADKRKVDGEVYDPFFSRLEEMVPDKFRGAKYPGIWSFRRQFERAIREGLLSEYVGWELAELFRGKTKEELRELAESFKFEKCVVRTGLNEILTRDAQVGANRWEGESWEKGKGKGKGKGD
ncbi:hypothetical protein MKZ38_010100 [Zalerion maritima]|uniref:Glycoside hydrolase family 5 domain-containing protein n=1 Tax=Zalerion maritima TaxID=339359 RepID=A0AAD5RGE5_9PEZI|nr:hypothetical protein MKZ38_010100 [Zalerion maritima]